MELKNRDQRLVHVIGMSIIGVGSSMYDPQKFTNGSIIWPSLSTSQYIDEGKEIIILSRYLHAYGYCNYRKGLKLV